MVSKSRSCGQRKVSEQAKSGCKVTGVDTHSHQTAVREASSSAKSTNVCTFNSMERCLLLMCHVGQPSDGQREDQNKVGASIGPPSIGYRHARQPQNALTRVCFTHFIRWQLSPKSFPLLNFIFSFRVSSFCHLFTGVLSIANFCWPFSVVVQIHPLRSVFQLSRRFSPFAFTVCLPLIQLN